MKYRDITLMNGDMPYSYRIYECDRCKEEVEEAWPKWFDDENDELLCWNCAFIKGRIPEREFLDNIGMCLPSCRAAVRDEEIHVLISGKFEWEKTPKDRRKSKQYKDWRTAVFERDDYTCQHCKQKGGELNAHHPKEFSKYPELRYDIDNGITLCLDCHRKEHKRMRSEDEKLLSSR